MSRDDDIARAARLVTWATLSGANPLIAADVACESLGLDPNVPEDRATFLALIDPGSFDEAMRREREALEALGGLPWGGLP